MSVERHEIHEQDVSAYLLCALSEVEEQRFEAHLEECPVCQDDVASLRVAVDALPRSVMPVRPPAALKAELMAVVEADLRETAAPAANRAPSVLARLRKHLTPAGAFSGLRPTVAWVGASIVLLAGVVTGAAGFSALSQSASGDTPRSVAAQVDKTRVPFGSGSLVVPENPRNGGVLRVHGMPELEGDSVYQVWVQRNGEVISQSLFHVGANGDGAAAVTEDLEDADAVMVTREAAGGAKAPSEKPVLKVSL